MNAKCFNIGLLSNKHIFIYFLSYLISTHPVLVQTASFTTNELTQKGKAEDAKSHPTSTEDFRRAALLPRKLDSFSVPEKMCGWPTLVKVHSCEDLCRTEDWPQKEKHRDCRTLWDWSRTLKTKVEVTCVKSHKCPYYFQDNLLFDNALNKKISP